MGPANRKQVQLFALMNYGHVDVGGHVVRRDGGLGYTAHDLVHQIRLVTEQGWPLSVLSEAYGWSVEVMERFAKLGRTPAGR